MARVLIPCSHYYHNNNIHHSSPPPPHNLEVKIIHQVNERLIINDLNGQELATTPYRPCPSHSVSFLCNPFCPSCHSELVDYFSSNGNQVHIDLIVHALGRRVENLLHRFDQYDLDPNNNSNETTNDYVFYVIESYISVECCYNNEEDIRAWLESESDFAVVKPTPASEAAIQALERLAAGGDQEVDSTTCAICLEEGSMTMSVRLPCKHVFHEGCIVKWLRKSNSCPLCRYELPVAIDHPIAPGAS